MTDRNFAEFREALKSDDLRKELAMFLANQNAETEEERILATVKFAADKGFAVTPEELSVETAEMRELTDEEVDNMAGGSWCWNDYSCFAVLHYDNCGAIMNNTCGSDARWQDVFCNDTAYKTYTQCGNTSTGTRE